MARQQGKSDLVKNAAVTAEVHIGPPMDLVGPVPQVTCAFDVDLPSSLDLVLPWTSKSLALLMKSWSKLLMGSVLCILSRAAYL